MKTEIQKFREEAGLTHQKLAGLVGVSKPHIWELEKKGGNPAIETAYKISKVLNRSVYEVFPDPFHLEGDPRPIRFVNLDDEQEMSIHYIEVAINDLSAVRKIICSDGFRKRGEIAVQQMSLAIVKAENAMKQMNKLLG